MSCSIPYTSEFPTGCVREPEVSPVPFKLRAGSKLIVEARDKEAAAEVFEQVARRGNLNAKTAKLARNLFFAQAEATGNYWIFSANQGSED